MSAATMHDGLDAHLDAVLRASGSGLKHYSSHKTLDAMRQAMLNFLQQRTTKPLTDVELLVALVDIDATTKRLPPGLKEFARAIEAAHGISTPEAPTP